MTKKKEEKSETTAQIGMRIRQRRRELNLSQTDVAKQIGLTKQQLSRIETGVSGTRSLKALAEALGMEPPWPMSSEQKSSNVTSKERSHIEMLRGFSQEFRIALEDLLNSVNAMQQDVPESSKDLSDEEIELIRCYRSVKARGKAAILYTAVQESEKIEREKEISAVRVVGGSPTSQGINKDFTIDELPEIPTLTVLDGPLKGKSLSIPSGTRPLVIGGDKGHDFYVPECENGNRVILTEKEGVVTAQSMMDLNVNGHRQHQKWLLTVGDVLRVGQTLFQFNYKTSSVQV